MSRRSNYIFILQIFFPYTTDFNWSQWLMNFRFHFSFPWNLPTGWESAAGQSSVLFWPAKLAHRHAYELFGNCELVIVSNTYLFPTWDFVGLKIIIVSNWVLWNKIFSSREMGVHLGVLGMNKFGDHYSTSNGWVMRWSRLMVGSTKHVTVGMETLFANCGKRSQVG